MKSKFIFLFLICINASLVAQAQDGAHAADPAQAAGTSAPNLTTTPAGVRPQGGANDPQKESSSFMGDPENIDPMKPKKENLKEDEEPVLEDIRQVLDEPEKKPVPKPEIKAEPKKVESSQAGSASAADSQFTPENTVAPSAPVQAPKAKALPPKKIKKQKVVKPHVAPKNRQAYSGLQSDDPDFRLEKKFNNIYNVYNAQPTSVESWSAVLTNRPSQIYVVQKGDTLWSISKTLFGDPNFWPKIWALNRMGIVNPHFITPGLQVMFYSGNEENVPSLALGQKSKDSNVEASDTDVESSLTTLSSGAAAGIIPDSLPLSRNDNYFLSPKTMQVDLQNDVSVPDIYENDILLTGEAIKTEVDVPVQEIIKGHCGGNHVLYSKVAMPANADFKIFELLENLKVDDSPIYAYRYVGQAHSMTDTKLKVKSCSTVMSDYLVFVSPNKVAALRSTKTSDAKEPQILGGPNIGTQSLFSDQQLIYINMGAQPASIGQSAFIRSQITEQTSGEVKILDKFGSIAVGVLTQVDDLIEKGDMVTLERQK